MNQETSYNGWRNYETWVANLWINESPQSQQVLLNVKQVHSSVSEQAELLREQLQQQLVDEASQPSLWQDLLFSAFSHIDWELIVKHN